MRAHRLESRVTFGPLRPRAELFDLVRAHHAVVVPSRTEGLGMVALEALALGRPVVASAVGGLVEVVEDGVDGVLVPADDVDALATALGELTLVPPRAGGDGTASPSGRDRRARRRVRGRADGRSGGRVTASSVDAVVLGGGPAGLMAGRRVAETGRSVIVLERAAAVGGMAGSFEIEGIRVDHGSHRLHRVLEPWLEHDLGELLGDDLQRRVRRGRIALAGRWLAFPLRMGDLARHLPRGLLARIALDTAASPFRRPKGDDAGSVIEARLGPTVARTFYTPYLSKLWDTPPSQLATELADRRVSARSGLSVVRKALATRKGGGGAFYLYPRRGFGQISEVVAEAAATAGADLRLGADVTGVQLNGNGSSARDDLRWRRDRGGVGPVHDPGALVGASGRRGARRARGRGAAPSPRDGARVSGVRGRPTHAVRRALLS